METSHSNVRPALFGLPPDDHGHAHHEEAEPGVHHVHGSKRQIWKVFAILLAITLLEFMIALTPQIKAMFSYNVKAAIFLFLTVLKAFYIVGFFMHLKHEKLNMGYSILIPLMFIAYLIALLMFEGSANIPSS